jgi:hypothetical protein
MKVDKGSKSLLDRLGGRSILILVAVMAVVFFFAASYSSRGWGYTGYYGYHRGPSFWYIGGPSIYRDPSVRRGSLGGPSPRRGGLGGGK